MKLLIKYYSNIYCSLIRAEEIEIKSNKILVSQLKEQISLKFHIPKCDIILTIKYENYRDNRGKADSNPCHHKTGSFLDMRIQNL